MSQPFEVYNQESYDQAADYAELHVSTYRAGLRYDHGYISDESQLLYNISGCGIQKLEYHSLEWQCLNCEHRCGDHEPLYLCLRVLGPDPNKKRWRWYSTDDDENYAFELACAQCSQSSNPPTRKDLYSRFGDIDVLDLIPISYEQMDYTGCSGHNVHEIGEPIENYVDNYYDKHISIKSAIYSKDNH